MIEPQPQRYAPVQDGDLRWKIEQAIRATLRDMLKAVRVRDVFINIKGRVKAVEYDESRDEYSNVVDYFHAAGNGVPVKWYNDPDTLWRFIDYVEKAGDGDAIVGMKRIMNHDRIAV